MLDLLMEAEATPLYMQLSWLHAAFARWMSMLAWFRDNDIPCTKGTPMATRSNQMPKVQRDTMEIKRLEHNRPLYDIRRKEWDFFLAVYEGGPDFANKENLFKHTREHEKDFDERAKRIYYENT
jgi:hypothetical protein